MYNLALQFLLLILSNHQAGCAWCRHDASLVTKQLSSLESFISRIPLRGGQSSSYWDSESDLNPKAKDKKRSMTLPKLKSTPIEATESSTDSDELQEIKDKVGIDRVFFFPLMCLVFRCVRLCLVSRCVRLSSFFYRFDCRIQKR